MALPAGVGPSNSGLPRQGKLTQTRYHRDGIWCVLFGKFQDQRNAQLIGTAKHQNLNHRLLKDHAEQLWWDDLSNVNAMRNAALRKDLEWFEFEVTRDFCAWPNPSDPTGGRRIRPCRDRFKQAREIVPPGKKIYIFIMRPQLRNEQLINDQLRNEQLAYIYYEVADNYGFVREQRDEWQPRWTPEDGA